MSGLSVHPTPNPNSLKFTSENKSFIDSGLRAYGSAAAAADDPLASALFTIEGVVDVLILPAFVTVTKQSGSDWNAMLDRIEATLRDHLA